VRTPLSHNLIRVTRPFLKDDSFSNAFSHGKGTGNVGDSGVAGVQRQQGLDPTGWVGEKTFNTLRSIRVPEGPHKDEMAMDANAANLIAEAWQMFVKNPATRTTRERALDLAIDFIGYTESPPGSNQFSPGGMGQLQVGLYAQYGLYAALKSITTWPSSPGRSTSR
jgi:hypothetical protein